MMKTGVLCLLLAAASAVSCAPESEPPERETTELRVPVDRDIVTLDPHRREAGEIVTHNVLRHIYEGLVEYDPWTLGIVPRLAQEYSFSEPDLTWTFRIRPGVSFADDPCFPGGIGRDITSEDAIYSIERGLSFVRRNPERIDVPEIEGIHEFLAGRSEHVEGLSAEDPRTLKIRMHRSDGYLLHYLARPPAYLVAREAAERYGEEMERAAVGTGPFRLAYWTPMSIYIVRRSDYWRRDEGGNPLPYLDAVRFLRTGGSHAAMHHLYANGQIDVFYSYTRLPDEKDLTRGIRSYTASWLNTIFGAFNYRSDHPCVADVRLRRLMASLVDPSGQYHHRRATGLFPPGLPGYDADLRKTQVSAEEARRILAEAGFPGGENLPELILAWPRRDSSTARDLAAILESLGIPAKYSVLKDEDFRDAVRSGEVDIFRQGWIADYPDPENFLQVFYSKSPINVGGYRNEEFDRLYESLRLETDEPSREALARTMERILIDDAAAIFLRHESQTQFVAAWVENWEGNCSNPLNVHYYERVRIDAGKRREYR